MTILRRVFGGRGQDAYARAIALVEDGQLAEALPLLRDIYAEDQASPRGAVTGYYLRQTLTGEGRRLLENGEHEAAQALLEEASAHWPEYPDLRFLAGAAASGAGNWSEALAHARDALRRNGDYCEARLLEATALQAMARAREAADSLNDLLESGRRVDHELARRLGRNQPYQADDLPADLPGLVRRAAVGDDSKRQLASAVALCRAGQWDEGLAAFAALAASSPNYPDVRAKYGAALYQAGRLDDALAEVDAALAINDRYRSAVSLRGLILAERGRLAEAARDLEVAMPRFEGTVGRHEELFLAYLRATLALLLGDRPACRDLLAGWHDLGRQFSRAELLLVACDDLDGRADAAQRRLDVLLEIWSADTELTFLRACLSLQHGQLAAVEDAITHWPGGAIDSEDERPLLLQACLALRRGHEPGLPDPDPAATGRIDPAAWRLLAARGHLLAGRYQAAWALLSEVGDLAESDEAYGRLWLEAVAVRLGGEPELLDHHRLAQPSTMPDSWVPGLCYAWRRGGAAGRAEQLIAARRRIHPEHLLWSWLSAAFWLDPVRRWIA